MFGDVGHGTLLLFVALGLIGCWKFMKNPPPVLIDAFNQKWLILLMAIFSIYCGFMYNECFSLPMGIFPTNWEYEKPIEPDDFAKQIDPDYVYPFGVDPVSKNNFTIHKKEI